MVGLGCKALGGLRLRIRFGVEEKASETSSCPWGFRVLGFWVLGLGGSGVFQRHYVSIRSRK